MHRVVVIGAGFGGLLAVRGLRLPPRLFLIPDAVGLALFTVVGTQVALEWQAPWLVALGAVSALALLNRTRLERSESIGAAFLTLARGDSSQASRRFEAAAGAIGADQFEPRRAQFTRELALKILT